MICLSKHLSDPFVNSFANSSKLKIVDEVPKNLKSGQSILFRSMLRKSLIERCKKEGIDFYYMDTGYFGNYKGIGNPHGHKKWHRIVKNDLQHVGDIIDRPGDRLRKTGVKISKPKKGSHILLVTPSEKPCKYYGIDLDKWIEDVLKEIKAHTDRPIKIRQKQKRQDRLENPIFNDLKDCHALVTYQSIAAIESVMSGVPAFTLAPTAADVVCDKDLSLIENPSTYDNEMIYKWACHLSYGQWHIDEIQSGYAYRKILEYYG